MKRNLLAILIFMFISSNLAFADQTLREQIAAIDKVSFLYASQAIEPFFLGINQTGILTDSYWYGSVSGRLHNLCEANGGKVEYYTKDPFTGNEIKSAGSKNVKSLKWECSGGKNAFDVNSIQSTLRANASVGGGEVKIFILINSLNSGTPVLSSSEKATIEKHPQGKINEYLDSFFSVFPPYRAVSKTSIAPDGSYEQLLPYRPEPKVDVKVDTGILYEINAFCASKGGNIAPVQGYGPNEIKTSILPTNGALFQCDSEQYPFYVKFRILSESRYNIYVKEGVLPGFDKNTVNATTAQVQPATQQQPNVTSSAQQAAEMQMLNVVNQNMPKAMLSDINNNISIYWVKQNSSCDNVAIIRTNKNSGQVSEINNFSRCNGTVKPSGNTPMPATVPNALKMQEPSLIGQTKASGSLYYFDTNSGITVIGRKTDNSCGVMLYYMKGENLVSTVNGGC